MTLAADLPTSFAAPRNDHAAPLTGKAAPTDRAAEMILWLVPVLLLGLVLAIKTWGLFALTLAALPAVPLMFVFFIAISWP
ncbi:hypothetical protein [Neotabrizicola sp. sgz301269]|uniref:hypothetical protein n=1 Tax=Neotabrizicola sp. sgz301269 TaxID=3276282 RepID=UPI00376F50D8